MFDTKPFELKMQAAFDHFETELKKVVGKVEKSKKADASEAEGPIIDAADRDDVVQGQDDVDDLLSSLGF